MPPLPPNSLIVITGITGFIASHIGLITLKKGHRVKGTVRSMTHVSLLKAGYQREGISHEDLEKRLAFTIVDDFYSKEQWAAAFDGADGVIHVAFPTGKETLRDPRTVDLTIQNVLMVLQAAHQVGTIKKFVYTSSTAAIFTPPMCVDRELTVSDWNTPAIELYESGVQPETSLDETIRRTAPFLSYGAAKAKAEMAAFKFMDSEKPSFDLVSIMPATTFGPLVYNRLPPTPNMIALSAQNDISLVPWALPQWFIDVRDGAILHYLGLVDDRMAGKRWMAASEPWGWNDIYHVLRKNFPGAKVPEDLSEKDGGTTSQKLSNSASMELIGSYISLEQSIVDTVYSLKDLGMLPMKMA